MFDLGIQELTIIFIVALVVFGPKRVPELGRTLGKGLAELRRTLQDIKVQMDSEKEPTQRPPVNFPSEHAGDVLATSREGLAHLPGRKTGDAHETIALQTITETEQKGNTSGC